MRWVDLTLTEAVERLAECAAHARGAMPTYAEKRAEGLTDVLAPVGKYLHENPTLMHGLIGGGVGALAGGGATALANMGEPEERRKSLLAGALTGGIAGGALGAGGSLLARNWPFSGGSAATAPVPTSFLHPRGGRYRFSPEVLAKYPDLPAQLSAANTPGAVEKILGAPLQAGSFLATQMPATVAATTLSEGARYRGQAHTAHVDRAEALAAGLRAGLEEPGLQNNKALQDLANRATGTVPADLLRRVQAGTDPDEVLHRAPGAAPGGAMGGLTNPAGQRYAPTDELTRQDLLNRLRAGEQAQAAARAPINTAANKMPVFERWFGTDHTSGRMGRFVRRARLPALGALVDLLAHRAARNIEHNQLLGLAEPEPAP